MLGSIRTRGLGLMYSYYRKGSSICRTTDTKGLVQYPDYYQTKSITPLIGRSPIDVTVVMFFNEEHNALCFAKGVGSSHTRRKKL